MNKTKRRKYLVEPSFQLKMSIYVCSCIMLTSLVHPMIIVSLYNSFVDVVQILDNKAYWELLDQKNNVIYILVIWQITMLFLCFTTCVFITHRVAGPIHKLKKIFKKSFHACCVEKIYFRKGDYFYELADLINVFFNNANTKLSGVSLDVEKVIQKLQVLQDHIPEDDKKLIVDMQDQLRKINQDIGEI